VCRIARQASGNLATMELFRVPEDKMQQNLEFLEKIIEKGHSSSEVALAAAEMLPDAHFGDPLGLPNPSPPSFLLPTGWTFIPTRYCMNVVENGKFLSHCQICLLKYSASAAAKVLRNAHISGAYLILSYPPPLSVTPFHNYEPPFIFTNSPVITSHLPSLDFIQTKQRRSHCSVLPLPKRCLRFCGYAARCPFRYPPPLSPPFTPYLFSLPKPDIHLCKASWEPQTRC